MVNQGFHLLTLAGVRNPRIHAAQQIGPFAGVSQDLPRCLVWSFAGKSRTGALIVTQRAWRRRTRTPSRRTRRDQDHRPPCPAHRRQACSQRSPSGDFVVGVHVRRKQTRPVTAQKWITSGRWRASAQNLMPTIREMVVGKIRAIQTRCAISGTGLPTCFQQCVLPLHHAAG